MGGVVGADRAAVGQSARGPYQHPAAERASAGSVPRCQQHRPQHPLFVGARACLADEYKHGHARSNRVLTLSYIVELCTNIVIHCKTGYKHGHTR